MVGRADVESDIDVNELLRQLSEDSSAVRAGQPESPDQTADQEANLGDEEEEEEQEAEEEEEEEDEEEEGEEEEGEEEAECSNLEGLEEEDVADSTESWRTGHGRGLPDGLRQELPASFAGTWAASSERRLSRDNAETAAGLAGLHSLEELGQSSSGSDSEENKSRCLLADPLSTMPWSGGQSCMPGQQVVPGAAAKSVEAPEDQGRRSSELPSMGMCSGPMQPPPDGPQPLTHPVMMQAEQELHACTAAQSRHTSSSSSEHDFLPEEDSAPEMPRGPGAGVAMPGLHLPLEHAARVMPSGPGSSRSWKRQSPSRAQHAAAAATAAGLTPRGINVQEYEDQGLWIPIDTSKKENSEQATVSAILECRAPTGYIDLMELHEGCQKQLEGRIGRSPPSAASASASPSEHVVPKTKLTRPVARPRLRGGPAAKSQMRRSVQSAPGMQATLCKFVQTDVAADSPVAPSDVVLEESQPLPYLERASGMTYQAVTVGAIGGLTEARHKVLRLREQVGALAAHCDRLEKAAGLFGNHLLSDECLGPAHILAMKAAVQQLHGNANEEVSDVSRRSSSSNPADDAVNRMQCWVDDLEKRTRAEEPRAVSEGCGCRVAGDQSESMWASVAPGQVAASVSRADEGAGPDVAAWTCNSLTEPHLPFWPSWWVEPFGATSSTPPLAAPAC